MSGRCAKAKDYVVLLRRELAESGIGELEISDLAALFKLKIAEIVGFEWSVPRSGWPSTAKAEYSSNQPDDRMPLGFRALAARADVIVTPHRLELRAEPAEPIYQCFHLSRSPAACSIHSERRQAHIKLRQVRADWRGRLPPCYENGKPESGPGYIAVANSPSSS